MSKINFMLGRIFLVKESSIFILFYVYIFISAKLIRFRHSV